MSEIICESCMYAVGEEEGVYRCKKQKMKANAYQARDSCASWKSYWDEYVESEVSNEQT